jgi:hypothetical protein
MKNPKWRIGVCVCSHHMVEIDAPNPQEAMRMAVEAVHADQEYYQTSFHNTITSVMVNDRESRDFACYVPEFKEVQNGK